MIRRPARGQAPRSPPERPRRAVAGPMGQPTRSSTVLRPRPPSGQRRRPGAQSQLHAGPHGAAKHLWLLEEAMVTPNAERGSATPVSLRPHIGLEQDGDALRRKRSCPRIRGRAGW